MSGARPNVWAELPDAPGDAGFAGRTAQASGQRIGASVYELLPGQTMFPYHFHRAIEELLVVLRGRPSLRTPDGSRELEEGEVVSFRVGPAGAHQITNRSHEPVRYTMFSTRGTPDVVSYPDSGKTGYGCAPQEGDEGRARALFFDADAVGYYDGERAPET
jgi:uncharacterized cupin superfamily protein